VARPPSFSCQNLQIHSRSCTEWRETCLLRRGIHSRLSSVDLVSILRPPAHDCRVCRLKRDWLTRTYRSRPVDPVLSTQYIKNSLVVDSPEMRRIQDCAAKNCIVVSLGFSENDHNSLYIAQAIIDIDGKILMKRRKLKATHMERTIFGDASGNSLMNVATTGIGRRVGALACWEHCQPLLKYHTLHQREEIHCSAWPPIVPHQGGPDLWSMSKEGWSFRSILLVSLFLRWDLR
jgi:hypothetical protein